MQDQSGCRLNLADDKRLEGPLQLGLAQCQVSIGFGKLWLPRTSMMTQTQGSFDTAPSSQPLAQSGRSQGRVGRVDPRAQGLQSSVVTVPLPLPGSEDKFFFTLLRS